ncbi:PhzF family phenazine biosynthesis protein [Microbacterium sediminicola]|uniref:PhzF family phenazine biosynthesis protein n=2 Tax=Microbacterium sediminicola TaxID=415210 RepID=A0ABP4U7U4_9MICO
MASVVNVFVDEVGDHGNPLGIVWASAATKKHEAEIAADLGFSETIFIDEISQDVAHVRIFTPAGEVRFGGHPVVGLASWLHEAGDDIRTISCAVGSARVRVEGERVFVNAMPEWTTNFVLERLSSPEEVLAVDPEAYSEGTFCVWAWIDEEAGVVRARVFAPDLGIREDSATGSAAIRLTAELGRDLQVVQGSGSVLYTHRRNLGREIEVGGRTSPERLVELA